MASSSADTPSESPYHGHELDKGEIRLLTIASTESGLALSTKPHKVIDNLQFDAISYVWGTAPATVEITCNGKPLLVTPTAHEMLAHLLHSRPSLRRPLWIDAICINQDSADEKAIQIPFMRHIFSRAARVIIWMGPSTSDTDIFMAKFPRVAKMARDWISTGAELGVLQNTHGWPWHDDPFWTGCYHLARREWFRRLWTFQEAVLARKAIVLSGASWVDLDDFLVFLANAVLGKDYIAPVLEGDAPPWIDLIAIYGYRMMSEGGPIHTSDIPTLLDLLRGRYVKEQVDRVWAITGLFEEDVQNELSPKVDYSVEARKHYFRTFIELAKILLAKQPGSLSLLYFPPSAESKNASLPSWCPDFSTRPACLMRINGGWNMPVIHPIQGHRLLLDENEDDEKSSWESTNAVHTHSFRSIITSKTDDLLHIRGFCVDTIDEIVEDSQLVGPTDFRDRWEIFTAHNSSYIAAMSWESRCLALARRILHATDEDIPPEYLMALFMDARINGKAPSAYVDAMFVLRNEDSESQYDILEITRKAPARLVIGQFQAICGHTFFSTKGGRIGLATPGCKPGDKLCVFYGGEPLYILRWPGCGDSANVSPGGAVVEFISVAFVPHLMDQHTSDDARLGEDEIYVIG